MDLSDLIIRLQDLFTRIKVEEVLPSEVNFHFALVQYWLFFALAYLGYTLVYNRKLVRSAYLLFVSLFFYWKVGAPFLYILLFSTVVDFYLGKAVYHARGKLKKKLFITASMITNLGILAYFKYFKFFASNWNEIRGLPDWLHIANAKENAIGMWLNGQFSADMFIDSLPMVVGISFYTFQTMSYSIDIYRGHIKPLKNIIDFGFFVSFFPQLVAGPIVRASEFVPQIHQKFKLTKTDFGWAVYMIMKGLIKKMIFADYIAVYFLDHVFASPDEFSGMANLIAIFGYSLQIYGDFAGYTDMAIGIAKLMGFQLPKNFNSPYKAKHCGEFWKRWHISLSSWLKDYLYIPLGGNRRATSGSFIVAGLIIAGVLYAVNSLMVTYIVVAVIVAATLLSWQYRAFYLHISRNINVTLTMLLGGLWHGASWQFVIWGGLNGIGVLATKYWKPLKNSRKVLVSLIIAGGFYLIKLSGGHEIWIVPVFWSLTVALISGIKALYDLTGKSTWPLYYVNLSWAMLHTLVFITFTRVYFRGESMLKIDKFYHQLLYDFRWDFSDKWLYASSVDRGLDYSWVIFAVIIVGYLVHWVPTKHKSIIQSTFIKMPPPAQAIIAFLVCVLCYQAYSAESAAFIYFQF